MPKRFKKKLVQIDGRHWTEFLRQEGEIRMWRQIDKGVFERGGVILSIRRGFNGFSVRSCMNHPLSGEKTIFRVGISREEMIKLFTNPRTHTGKGFVPNNAKKSLEEAFEFVEKHKDF